MRLQACHYCGGPGGTVDHKIPFSQGGKGVRDNCLPACFHCNQVRGNQPYQDFKGSLEFL